MCKENNRTNLTNQNYDFPGSHEDFAIQVPDEPFQVPKDDNWVDLTDRNYNFHGNHEDFDRQVYADPFFYMSLYDFKTELLQILEKDDTSDKKVLLRRVFLYIYLFLCGPNNNFSSFNNSSPYFKEIFEACYFTTLCNFLHDTTKIDSKNQQTFIKDNSPHYPLHRKAKDGPLYLSREKDSLRQYKHRLYEARPTSIIRKLWKGISADSEYEWALRYELNNADKNIKDTFKDVRTLYNSLIPYLQIPNKTIYETNMDEVKSAYKKFKSKLKKLKFQNFMELQNFYISYICKNETYYGINLYRYEKENRLFITTSEITTLLNCNSDDEEKEILAKSSILNDIFYPKLYNKFSSSLDMNELRYAVSNFLYFRQLLVTSSRLIIDELVEKNYFGENWSDVFLEVINELAENVFYNINELDFSLSDKPGTQKYFEKIISQPVRDLLFNLTGNYFD